MAVKQVQLLRELVPTATTMALLVNPTNPTLAPAQIRAVQETATALGLELNILHASTEGDFDTVFARAVQLQAGALVIAVDALFAPRIQALAALALNYRMPATFPFREFAAAAWSATEAAMRRRFALWASTPARLSRARSPPIYPLSSPLSSSSWST